LTELAACRTAALGGHVQQCDTCGRQEVSYNSCRNRHCPKCQGAARAAWLEARRDELLPVPYFHVVFTLPHELAPLALVNAKAVYGLLFQAARDTLLEVAANPQRLGARIGGLMVLHTWGQNLEHHPHVHCVVPGGGLSPDGTRWIGGPSDKFFLPVKVLSAVFRGKFLAGLNQLWQRGKLQFPGQLAELVQAAAWTRLCAAAANKPWVVYAKPPFGGPEQVLKYLARYTHRVALSNDRLLELQDGRVTFSWKNYAAGGQRQRMTLSAVEFLRRFLLHVLPKGLVRIRHFGLWANCHRQAQLDRCRRLLNAAPQETPAIPVSEALSPQPPAALPEPEAPRCAHCGQGRLLLIECLPPPRRGELRDRVRLFDPPASHVPYTNTS
jgi:hypothetical protein